MSSLAAAGVLLGGVGMLLLAVKLVTGGLRVAAGERLRRLLARSTRSPARGIAAGVLITAVAQSSSAVTVATIGFVNSGLLSMKQSLRVLYGANVGTAMTGWLVVATGFAIPVETFALPLIGAGMLLRLTGPDQRRGGFGKALAGFGLLIVGIDVLRGAFEQVAAVYVLDSLPAQTPAGIMLFLGLGFVVTVLTQSSSAAIALILTAAVGDVLTLAAAAAAVIGASLGTTTAAALAISGATANTKRAAAAHITLNLVTAIVALAVLPLLLRAVRAGGGLPGMEVVPAVSLAMFHTLFSVLGVAVLWPWSARLARVLSGYFRSTAGDEGAPRFLDRAAAVTPALALDALVLELDRMRGMSQAMGRAALTPGGTPDAGLKPSRTAVEQLLAAVSELVCWLSRGRLPTHIVAQLPLALRTAQDFDACAGLALACEGERKRLPLVSDVEAAEVMVRFRSQAAHVMAPGPRAADADLVLEDMQSAFQDLRETLLAAGAARRMRVDDMSAHVEQASRLRRMVEQYAMGARLLARLASHTAQAQSLPGTAGRALHPQPAPTTS